MEQKLIGWRIESETLERLRVIAEAEDRSVNSLVRLILRAFLDAEGQRQAGGNG